MAMSRFWSCAVSISPVSCGSAKPLHQDTSGHIRAAAGTASVKELGTICGGRDCGTGVEQPASASAATRPNGRDALLIAQRVDGVGAGDAQGMGEDGRPCNHQRHQPGAYEIDRAQGNT